MNLRKIICYVFLLVITVRHLIFQELYPKTHSSSHNGGGFDERRPGLWVSQQKSYHGYNKQVYYNDKHFDDLFSVYLSLKLLSFIFLFNCPLITITFILHENIIIWNPVNDCNSRSRDWRTSFKSKLKFTLYDQTQLL